MPYFRQLFGFVNHCTELYFCCSESISFYPCTYQFLCSIFVPCTIRASSLPSWVNCHNSPALPFYRDNKILCLSLYIHISLLPSSRPPVGWLVHVTLGVVVLSLYPTLNHIYPGAYSNNTYATNFVLLYLVVTFICDLFSHLLVHTVYITLFCFSCGRI